MPPLLYLDDIALTFGGDPLLAGASMTIAPGERLCLVGRNGSGKSTLMRIAAGLVEPDSGERFLQPGATLRYLAQEPDISGHATVLSYVTAGLGPGGDAHRAGYLLEEMGLDGERAPDGLSGGEMRRAALARTLAPQPDILLLDEPTNHLDLPAIEWLETELGRMKSALVLISHDRRFLETLSRKTLWLDGGRTRLLDKGFGAFEAWRDKLIEEAEEARHKLDRKIVREEHWITHGVTGRRRRNMRRLGELAELRRQRAETRSSSSQLVIDAGEAERSGRLVAEMRNVSVERGGKRVVDSLSLILRRGDRLGIIGPNGAGKTTLVQLLTGTLEPASGSIRLGANVAPLVIDQKREMLDPDWTLRQALTDDAGDQVALGERTKHVMSYMKDFLFAPEQAGTPLRALSGGERGRLMLARGLRHPANLLVLDEPTNDLDIETLDLLQEFLADYSGTVVLVSHDRDFLDRICTSVLASQGNGEWIEYAGGYSDMLAQRGPAGADRRAPARKTGKAAAASPAPAGKARGGKDGGRKLTFRQKHALETLPAEIARLQGEIGKLKQALEDPQLFSREPKKFETYAAALAERETALAEKEEQWLELEMLKEAVEGSASD